MNYLKYAILLAANILLLDPTHAGVPAWTFSAPSPLVVTVSTLTTTTVQYTVTNQSNKTKDLILPPTQGLSASACHLAGKGSTCNITITINGQNVPMAGLHRGRILCEKGNLLQCYQPSPNNALNVTKTNTFGYVADFTQRLWQCPLTTTGSIADGACLDLIDTTPPGFFEAAVARFATFAGGTYLYVPDGSNQLWLCPLPSQNTIAGEACTSLTNATSPGFSMTTDVAFATFSGNTYGYVSDFTSHLWLCPITATGTIAGGACLNLTNSTAPGFQQIGYLTLATFSGSTYLYAPDNTHILWQCPLSATGTISGGACTALTNATAPGFFATAQVTFATFSGITYAYVADFSNILWKCPVTATGTIAGGACTALPNDTSPGFNTTDSITIATFAGTTYAYVPDGTPTLWQCPMTATGDFTTCNALTNATSPGFLFTGFLTLYP